MSTTRNEFLSHVSSDESDGNDQGYDSEAAEVSKTARNTSTGRDDQQSHKRRKLSHSSSDEDEAEEKLPPKKKTTTLSKSEPSKRTRQIGTQVAKGEADSQEDQEQAQSQPRIPPTTSSRHNLPSISTMPTEPPPPSSSTKLSKSKSTTPPGVIYLSSLPPYLKPSALRNLLLQRGFTPITRLFLTPSSKSKTTSKKNSRQLYSEGWIEFGSKKTARRCAETLNAHPVGGRKGGFYHDDVWNMKYLRGMGWDELMAGVREERREEEGRRDEERRVIARETRMFVEGVEEGKRLAGMRETERKRSQKKKKPKNMEGDMEENGGGDMGGDGGGGSGEVRRTWRQYEVKGLHDDGGKEKKRGGATRQGDIKIGDDVKQVLGKIF